MNKKNILTAEFDSSRQKVLIVRSHPTHFLQLLKSKLVDCTVHQRETYDGEDDCETYDVIFFIEYTSIILSEFTQYPHKKFIFISSHNYDEVQSLSSYAYDHKLLQVKIIYLQTDPEYYEKDITTLLWFSFSPTEDIYLHIYHTQKSRSQKPLKKMQNKKKFKLTMKSVIFTGLLFFITAHLLFVPPLIMASYWHFRAFVTMKTAPQTSARYVSQATSALDLTQSLYIFSQPVFHFLSIALPIEDIIVLNKSTNTLLKGAARLQKHGSLIYQGVFDRNKTDQQVQELKKSILTMQSDVSVLTENLELIHLKLPDWNDQLVQAKVDIVTYLDALTLVETLTPHLDILLAEGGEKQYLLLFANNMELRPGGGFIGSFATVKVHNYTIEAIEVFDVYDADGQLKEPTEPPAPIGEILNQPYWFVRDSAFTGDFVYNFKEAELLLDEEIQTGSFDGGLLITTTAVQELLSAVDALYIPDFQETITHENFYIKAQLYAESSFFPGSRQKKSFLSSVMDQLLLGLPDVSMVELVRGIEHGLNTKQLVIYSKNPTLQQVFEQHYWAGRTLKPHCTIPEALHCIPDYIMPLDANLGVNKANFFVSRPMSLNVSIDESGTITNTATLTYTNDSLQDVFPGGPYKNYFQLMIPPNAQIKKITIDEVPVEDFDETNLEYKIVGFLVEIPVQTTKVVTVTYVLPTTIVRGDGVYQLIFQKQIGSENANLTFTFDHPDNVSITRHNLSPLAKGADILYNTSISSGKIFLIEFSKK
ncbi:MAG: DUF4012 domain-containing protein [bacterium]|nr:DUF4012 domain-containing protein [bacterium]